MQYETIKNSGTVISLDDAINRQIAVGFIDEPEEIYELHKKLGISSMQASGDVEIISCSYGYTRKVTDPHNASKSLKLVAYNKDGDSDKNLVFGMKLETEGILFDIDRVKILEWLLKNNIIEESQMPDTESEETVKKWFAQNVHGDRVSTFGECEEGDDITKNVFMLLHSMAHAFIKTAGEMSGLSANSITELIFIDTCSIFIYSQSNQGQVLGSLSGMIESIYSRFLKRVYVDNRECVFDPICVAGYPPAVRLRPCRAGFQNHSLPDSVFLPCPEWLLQRDARIFLPGQPPDSAASFHPACRAKHRSQPVCRW